MKNNAMKSVNASDNSISTPLDDFPWTEQECGALGVDRQLAFLAWNILQGASEINALTKSGYDPRLTKMWLIASKPSYLRAMRVMSTQYLNAVAFPISVKALVAIAQNNLANDAARVKAANVLMEYSNSTLQAFKDEFGKGGKDMSPDALDKMIRHLEGTTHDVMADVQIPVQMDTVDDYLTDMS